MAVTAFRALCVAVLATVLASSSVHAQEVDGKEDTVTLDLGDIVVVGTRIRGVAQGDLAVPVDVYEIRDITATGTTDLAVALQKAAPSFNSKRNVLGDGGMFHTAVLRGMSPDHTLLLVNGKRRHGISFPRPLDQVGQGTTGADLRAIPIAAIERIEVLRDGAASQYGSDAISGVINVVLKEDPYESTASVYAGRTGERDGERSTMAANLGFPLGSAGGAINLTLEVSDQKRTDRAFDTSHLDPNGANNPPVERKIVLGEPEHDNKSVFLNATAPVHDMGELYAFGGWSLRRGLSSGAWRDPIWAPERMVGPVHPNGFLPFEKSESEDRALTIGFLSELGGWDYDLSAGYGSNIFDFGAVDSINASWAAGWLQSQRNSGGTITREDVIANAGPRSGDSGGTKLENWAVDLDTFGEISLGESVFDVALGTEYRWETFRIRAGDYASWGCGPPGSTGSDFEPVTLDPNGNVATIEGATATCGFQGYPGYSPVNAKFGATDRESWAVWADVRHDVTAAWNVETAFRWENYQGAGSSLTGMVGSRYDLSPVVSLRGTGSTGFRAPSLPQRGFNTIVFSGASDSPTLSVDALLEEGGAHKFFDKGPATLDHETSRSLSAGVVLTPTTDILLSADVYWIDLEDRITLTSFKPNCDGEHAGGCASLRAERNVQQIDKVSYFDNAVDTRTVGLDVVASYDRAVASGMLTLTGALHFNRTKIVDGGENISAATRSFITQGNPRQQHLASADWTDGTFDLRLGVNYYGKTAPWWFNVSKDCPGEISSARIAGFEAGWRVGGVRIALGADNLLDEYPNNVSEDCSGTLNDLLGWGIRYSPDTSYGLSGRIFYTRLDMTF